MTHHLDRQLQRKRIFLKTVNEIKSVIDIEAQKAVEAGLITDRATMENG